MPERDEMRDRIITVSLIAVVVLVFIGLGKVTNDSTARNLREEREYPTPVYTIRLKPTTDSSIFQSDTRYGDYYYVRRTNIEIIVNCKTGQVLTRSRTTGEEADATALAKSMGVDWSDVCN